jgi:hypothetical protein
MNVDRSPTTARATLLCALLAACGAPPAEQTEQAEQPFAAVADMPELMLTVVEPAAEYYWDAVGWIDDASGTTEIQPRTDEEWEAVRNAAFVIAESGNLLMMGDRALPEAGWIPMSRALVDVGRLAIRAAESRDPLEVFNAGAEVYYVCTNCHAAFALETLRPADERTEPGGR